jgi:homoserine dehydrogenase
MKTNQSPHSSIKVGIIGLGTVGSAVAHNLQGVPGIQLKIAADLRQVKAPCPLTHDPMALIHNPDIDVVIETIGGIEPAKKFILAALNAKKHVVTANKELLAHHLPELLTVAEKNNVSLLYEAAVGGGIPIINTLRYELSGNRINELYGIVNGTTNYILSKMTQEGREFANALKKAQELGFAEADPKADVEGYDAAYKAVILAAAAFGAQVKLLDVYREGIEKIGVEDINYAYESGYVIKLLAIARRAGGQLEVRVHPALIPFSHPLASVSDNFNAIYVKGEPVGELMFYGRGAGGDPTSSAVINDVLAIANEKLKIKNEKLMNATIRKIDDLESRYYIRMQAQDQHGVLAGIAKAFADKKVSIAAVTQKETVGKTATIIIMLHQTVEKNLQAALSQIKKLSLVRKVSNVIRIVE